MQQSRRRQPSLGVMLLFYQIFGVIGYDRIPPVTLGTIGLQVAIFLRLFKLPWYKPAHVCVSAYRVLTQKEYMRLIYAAFEHADDWHLYYNMLSFAMKGQSLERRYGSVQFAYILAVFTVLTNAVLVALNVLTREFFDDYADQCAVGFSGVIFALKVLTTYYDTNYTHQIMGLPLIVPARYAVWVELVLIQLFVPNASFYGHLAGILVGMAYVKGPLKYIMNLFYSMVKAILFTSNRPQFTPQSGPSGYAHARGPFSEYVPPRNNSQAGPSGFAHSSESYNEYVPPGMSEEEQLRRAMEESMQEETAHHNVPPYPTSSFSSNVPPAPGFVFADNLHSPPPAGFAPDIEELRNKRQARFTYS